MFWEISGLSTTIWLISLILAIIGEDSWESLGLQGDQISRPQRKSVLNINWKDWGWSWNSSILATWCKEPSHWERPWCWERLKAGGEGDNRGWDVWMASPTRWTWVWESSGSWWWTGNPGVLQSMGSQRVRYSWATEHACTNPKYIKNLYKSILYKIQLKHGHWDIFPKKTSNDQ